MHCLYCIGRIGFFRGLIDSRFCCGEHRRAFQSKSAKAVRDLEDEGVFGAVWRADVPLQRRRRTGGSGMIVVLVIAVLALFGLSSFSGNSGSGAPPAASADSAQPSLPTRGSGMLNRLTGGVGFTQRENFQTGLSDWRPLAQADGWMREAEAVRPGRLRLWRASESMADYDFEFLGQIQRRSLGWAFRAADGRNYYAAKLAVPRAGGSTSASLIRYVVLNGRVMDRMELPLPVTLQPRTDYRVTLTVRGHEFLTAVDGQVVSAWRDHRLTRGGVGFFSEDGESSLLKWARLAERDSLVGKVLSHFSFFLLPPGFVLPAEQLPAF